MAENYESEYSEWLKESGMTQSGNLLTTPERDLSDSIVRRSSSPTLKRTISEGIDLSRPLKNWDTTKSLEEKNSTQTEDDTTTYYASVEKRRLISRMLDSGISMDTIPMSDMLSPLIDAGLTPPRTEIHSPMVTSTFSSPMGRSKAFRTGKEILKNSRDTCVRRPPLVRSRCGSPYLNKMSSTLLSPVRTIDRDASTSTDPRILENHFTSVKHLMDAATTLREMASSSSTVTVENYVCYMTIECPRCLHSFPLLITQQSSDLVRGGNATFSGSFQEDKQDL